MRRSGCSRSTPWWSAPARSARTRSPRRSPGLGGAAARGCTGSAGPTSPRNWTLSVPSAKPWRSPRGSEPSPAAEVLAQLDQLGPDAEQELHAAGDVGATRLQDGVQRLHAAAPTQFAHRPCGRGDPEAGRAQRRDDADLPDRPRRIAAGTETPLADGSHQSLLLPEPQCRGSHPERFGELRDRHRAAAVQVLFCCRILTTVRSFDDLLELAPDEHSDYPPVACGDHFFYWSPDGSVPRTQPFATIITKNYPDDVSSDLDPEGRWRVNVHVGRRRIAQFAPAEPVDPAAADVLQPHPLYARQGWICAVVPADRTLDPVLELLELACFDQRRRLGSALDSESAVREDRAP